MAAVRQDQLRPARPGSETDLIGITNGGKASGRTKAAVVIDAAKALQKSGLVHASDLNEREDAARRAYMSTKGCGQVTWQYFRMLLGYDDVKPDTWVMRFVNVTMPAARTPGAVSALVVAVADRLDVPKTDLDHAIWRFQRGHPQGV